MENIIHIVQQEINVLVVNSSENTHIHITTRKRESWANICPSSTSNLKEEVAQTISDMLEMNFVDDEKIQNIRTSVEDLFEEM